MNRKLALGLGALLLVAASVSTGLAQQSKTHLGGKASSMVRLWASVSPGNSQPFYLANPDGTMTPGFTLPADTVLVITDVSVGVNIVPSPGVTRGGVHAGTGPIDPYFSVDFTKQAGQAISLTGGAVYSVTPLAINAADSADAVFMSVYGYLAKNK